MQEKDFDLVPLTCIPTRGRTHTPGMCPDRESNQRPFRLQDNTQPTEPHQWLILNKIFIKRLLFVELKHRFLKTQG